MDEKAFVCGGFCRPHLSSPPSGGPNLHPPPSQGSALSGALESTHFTIGEADWEAESVSSSCKQLLVYLPKNSLLDDPKSACPFWTHSSPIHLCSLLECLAPDPGESAFSTNYEVFCSLLPVPAWAPLYNVFFLCLLVIEDT